MAICTLAGCLMGFLLGCIVLKPESKRERWLKIAYWQLIVLIPIFGVLAGPSIPASLKVEILAWGCGISLLLGFIQFIFEGGLNSSRRVKSPD